MIPPLTGISFRYGYDENGRDFSRIPISPGGTPFTAKT
jgi:hypothetical protein